jgi:hypothetical protein
MASEVVSPAIERALASVKSAVQQELEEKSLTGADLATVHALRDENATLKNEVASLKASQAEALKALESASRAIVSLEKALADSMSKAKNGNAGVQQQHGDWGLFECLNFPKLWAQEEAKRQAEVGEEARARVHKQVLSCAANYLPGYKSSQAGKPLLTLPGVDSNAVTALSGGIAKETGMSVADLKSVPITDKTTMDSLAKGISDLAYARAMSKAKNGGADADVGGAIAAATAGTTISSTGASKGGSTSVAISSMAASAKPSIDKLLENEADVLQRAGFPHFAGQLGPWSDVVRAVDEGRTQTLNHLKENGVSKLQDRQKLATALSKIARGEAK